MRISHRHKFVFIAIQKTGSGAVRHALNEYSDIASIDHSNQTDTLNFPNLESHILGSHLTAKEVNKLFFKNNSKKFKSYFKFAFVRNPWDRMVSWYEHMKAEPWITNSRIQNYIKLNYSLSDFLRSEYEMTNNKKNKTSYYFGYNKYYEGRAGKNLLDFIGKLENLQEDLDIVCDKIGITRQKLKHFNKRSRRSSGKRKHKHYTEYYDDESQQIVAEKYAKDIEYFNYKFGE